MEQTGIKRLYYSISEVSNLVDEEQYVLRYWETEFEQLRPQKNRAGNRIYNEKDIQIIGTIQQLLRIRRFTIDGAKEHLKTMQFESKTVEESPVNGEAFIDSSSNGVADTSTAEQGAEFATDLLPPAEQNSDDNAQPAAVGAANENESEQQIPHPINGDGYSFSRTMQAEWHEPLDTVSMLSITVQPLAAESPEDKSSPSEERFGEQPASNQFINDVLPVQTDVATSLETVSHTILSRADLLDLRDTLRDVLRLIEPSKKIDLSKSSEQSISVDTSVISHTDTNI